MAPDALGLSSYSSFSILFALISLLPHIRKQNPHSSSSLAASLHHQEESTLLGASLGFNFTPDYSNAHVCTTDVKVLKCGMGESEAKVCIEVGQREEDLRIGVCSRG